MICKDLHSFFYCLYICSAPHVGIRWLVVSRVESSKSRVESSKSRVRRWLDRVFRQSHDPGPHMDDKTFNNRPVTDRHREIPRWTVWTLVSYSVVDKNTLHRFYLTIIITLYPFFEIYDKFRSVRSQIVSKNWLSDFSYF